MQIAIISDIHGNLLALETVLSDIRRRKPDLTLNLGDCVSGPFWPKETYDLLKELDLPTVRGNHDRWLAERNASEINPGYNFACEKLSGFEKQKLGNLPSRLHLDEDIFAFHGTPDNDTKYLLEDNVDGRLALARGEDVHKRIGQDHQASLYLCGHSHLAHVAMGPNNSTIINPGSVGCPRYTDTDNPLEAENGIALAHYAIATKTKQRWSVELIALDYDWSKVAEQAERNGYPGWAQVFT
ncbi:metallophosphoesterase family protein [Kiloniella sp.]|uniref:metallophosphoesterase family protein n=1 Tax=Kiloniella sp. TaxID=1938587 RepID=UPI003A949FDF